MDTYFFSNVRYANARREELHQRRVETMNRERVTHDPDIFVRMVSSSNPKYEAYRRSIEANEVIDVPEEEITPVIEKREVSERKTKKTKPLFRYVELLLMVGIFVALLAISIIAAVNAKYIMFVFAFTISVAGIIITAAEWGEEHE